MLALAEATLMTMTAVLALVPLHVQQGDLAAMKMVDQLQHGMNRIAEITMALGSTMVQPKGEPTPEESARASGLILPG